MSAFAVIWEMVTALEKGAAPFESWSGRLEVYDTVVEIDSWKKKNGEREMAVAE